MRPGTAHAASVTVDADGDRAREVQHPLVGPEVFGAQAPDADLSSAPGRGLRLPPDAPSPVTRSPASGAMQFSLLLDDASHFQIAMAFSPFVLALRSIAAVATVVVRLLAAPMSSLASAVTVFGPKDYVRGTGQPVTVTDTFSIAAPTATSTLHLDNGGLHGQYALVSSAVITLNARSWWRPTSSTSRSGSLKSQCICSARTL